MNKEKNIFISDVSFYPNLKGSVVKPEDFIIKNKLPVNLDKPFESHRIPYCFNFPNGQIIYALDTNPVDLSNAAFNYLYLRNNTKRILTLPWEARLNEGLRNNVQPTFIFSPGRCGSTLMSNLIRAMGAISLSEPDFYTQVINYAKPNWKRNFTTNRWTNKISPSMSIKMIPYLTEDLLEAFQEKEKIPIIIKLRASSEHTAKIMLSSLKKNPKTIFITRHFHEWAESKVMTFGSSLKSCLASFIQSINCYHYLKANSNCFL